MIEVIFNEKEHIEQLMSDYDLSGNMVTKLKKVAKYYYGIGKSRKEVEHEIREYMIRCEPHLNLAMYKDVIDSAMKDADKYPLIDVESVYITKNEIKRIRRLKGEFRQKLMFTLIFLARYCNTIVPTNNNWVRFEPKVICQLANVRLTTSRRNGLFNDLIEEGLIDISRVIGRTNPHVLFMDDDSDIAVCIDNPLDIGNQYLMYIGKKYAECRNCGQVFKYKQNVCKYCSACAKEVNIRKTLENYHARKTT